MNQNEQKRAPKQSNTEAVLAILLLVLCVCLIAIAVVAFTAGGEEVNEPVTTTTTSGTQDPDNGEDVIDPSLLVPVFSGGVLPTVLPIESAESVLLTDEIHSPNGVIINATDNIVLAGKNANVPMAPASMTKVMTLIVACEKLTKYDLTQKMTITEYYTTYDYNGLEVGLIGEKYIGDEILIEDILYGIGVSSAADCVLMIAEYTYGSLGAFVAAMNQKAAEMNLTVTHFADAAGDEFEGGNVTTATEMAVIMAYAMQNPMISKILSTKLHVCYGYYMDNGVEKTYRRYFNSTLFESDSDSSRMKRYKKAHGASFVLTTAVDLAGKTGYLTDPDRSYLVCAATGSTTGKKFMVVVGEQANTVHTMEDIKYLFDRFAK